MSLILGKPATLFSLQEMILLTAEQFPGYPPHDGFAVMGPMEWLDSVI
jgi:hypothetical protein